MEDGFTILEGNCLSELEKLEENSVDAIVTDPPYGLTSITKRFAKEGSAPAKYGKDGSFARLAKGFMGKEWDGSGVEYNIETWKKCMRVLKPGGYMLAFGGTRTYHRIACAVEDAGFEIRDCVMWLYGCLSEDTEVLTDKGFKHFHKITKDDKIRIYDAENNIYQWERPERWNVYKTEQDTCYRIKSDSTDQLVSRNHRCLVERDGKLVFEFAENLNDMERVPILSYDIPFIQEGKEGLLFTDLLWQDERLAEKIFSEWSRQEEPEKIALRGNEPKLERWCDLSEEKRKLCQSKNKVCEVSEGVYDDGEKRWLCDGTQANGGTTDKQAFIKNRSCPSYQPQCRRQQTRKLDAICNEPRTQAIRGWKTYKTTLATITKEEYSGYLYCPTVSTGCFVARRAGKVFITGNSGFPKSLNIGLAVDKKNGVESKVIGKGKSGKEETHTSSLNMVEGGFGGEYEIKQAQNKWAGWGTALKPSYEPIIVARKPFKGSCVDNVMGWGVGGINIDGCRIETDDNLYREPCENGSIYSQQKIRYTAGTMSDAYKLGRFPANTILDTQDGEEWRRYFYCPKASKKDRDEGLENRVEETVNDGRNTPIDNPFTPRKNTHPTVKPTSLMQYLVRLVSPKGATILDPFMGSGSTGKAVAYENLERNADYKFIGIEKDPEYCEIAKARIKYVVEKQD